MAEKYNLTEADIDRIDLQDLNPMRRAAKIQALLVTSDPYDVLCFCIVMLPGLITSAPEFIHYYLRKTAAFVYQYHYFIRNKGK